MTDLPAEAITAAALAYHKTGCLACSHPEAQAPCDNRIEADELLIGEACAHAAAPALRQQGATTERQRLAADFQRRADEIRAHSHPARRPEWQVTVANVLANEAWNLTHEREVLNLTEPASADLLRDQDNNHD